METLSSIISGAYGIGLVQKSHMDIIFDRTFMQLIRQIKRIFDPEKYFKQG
jgi:glycolate oxidase